MNRKLVLSVVGLSGLLGVGQARPALAQDQADPFSEPVNGVRRVDPGWHALMHATVHTEPGTTIEDGTVVIRDGRVELVIDHNIDNRTQPLAIPEGARVWDCDGLHLYPGLIDAWIEVDAPAPSAADPGAHWNGRVTPQRSALDGAGIDAGTAKSLRALGFAAAGMSPKSGIFRGTGALVSLSAEGDAIEGSGPLARRRVYREAVYQAAGLDTRGGGYPNSQGGAIALMRQTLSDADYYAALRTAGETPDANCLLHLQRSFSYTPLAFDVDDEIEALRAAKIAREFERRYLIVGSGLEFRRLDAIAADGSALIVPLRFPDEPQVASVGDAAAADLRDLMTWEQAPTNPRRLAGAGLEVALTTSKVKKRDAFRANLRTAIEHGLSEDDALAMLTTKPAAMLGAAEQLGTLERGRVANIVVADGPLFAKETKIRDVWIDGQRHEINPPPPVDLSGEWEIVTDPPVPDATIRMLVKHDARKGKAPKITITKTTMDAETGEEKEARSEAKNVVLAGDALTFTFEHEPFGEPGVFVSSGLVEKGADPLVIRFDAIRASGKTFRWTATWTDKSVEQPGDEEQDADKERRDEKDDAQDYDNGEDHDLAADVPEEYGYPFGPYALGEVPAQEYVVITGATIWTCGPQGILDPGTMIVHDGQVQLIGPGDPALSSRSDARVIDASGKHITPGLIDCHSHTGLFSGGVNESGQSVTAEVRMGDITYPDTISWYRQLAGGITAANQLHGSANPIGGQSQTVKNRWGCVHPDDMHMEGAKPGIKFALGENVKRSNSTRPQTRYPATRMGVETLIRDRFTAAREYAERREGSRSPPGSFPLHVVQEEMEKERTKRATRRDLELDALAEILAGERLVHCHSYRQDEILMLCRVAGEFGFTIGTFQHILEGYKVAEAIRENAIGASAFSDWWAYKVEVQDAIPYNGAIMHEVGVNVSFNSDSDELARRMNVEAAKAVKYGGVSPEEALKFVTLNPAIQLGVEDRVGSLEKGKDADFVIWSGDPLSTLSRAESTWVDGREYFSLEKDAAHRERIAAERTRIIQKILGAQSRERKLAEEGDEPDETPKAQDRPIVDSPPEHWIVRQQRDALREHYLDLLNRGMLLDAAVCGECGCTMEDAQ